MAEITVQSPLGPLTLAEADGSITQLDWRAARRSAETPLLREARRQLLAYFAGKLREFDLPLSFGAARRRLRLRQQSRRHYRAVPSRARRRPAHRRL